MTDKLKIYEFRCRGRIKARSEEDAKTALNVSNIVMTAKMELDQQILEIDPDGKVTKRQIEGEYDVHIRLSSIEVLGEVEGE